MKMLMAALMTAAILTPAIAEAQYYYGSPMRGRYGYHRHYPGYDYWNYGGRPSRFVYPDGRTKNPANRLTW